VQYTAGVLVGGGMQGATTPRTLQNIHIVQWTASCPDQLAQTDGINSCVCNMCLLLAPASHPLPLVLLLSAAASHPAAAAVEQASHASAAPAAAAVTQPGLAAATLGDRRAAHSECTALKGGCSDGKTACMPARAGVLAGRRSVFLVHITTGACELWEYHTVMQ
jgi:hypothetical protein